MKKIFILTGEPSGDKLAATVISDLKKINKDTDFLSVGGQHLQTLGIKSSITRFANTESNRHCNPV